MGMLPPRQRAALVLRYVHDLPQEDIAEVFALPTWNGWGTRVTGADVLIVVASRTPLVSRGVREWRDSARPGWWGQTLQSAADSGISRATMPSALTSNTPTCRRMASTPSCLR